jgi:DNA-binding HxlR family transcriptional regulator
MVARRTAVPKDGVRPQDGEERRGLSVSAIGESNPVELDRLIHERVRLGIVSALAVNATLSFNELKELLKLSDGNLSVHARKLEDAGYIACTKSFDERIPRTEYQLTAPGRRALEHYIGHMEALIQAVREE